MKYACEMCNKVMSKEFDEITNVTMVAPSKNEVIVSYKREFVLCEECTEKLKSFIRSECVKNALNKLKSGERNEINNAD